LDLDKYLKEKRILIDNEIEKILKEEPAHPLAEIYSYTLEGGKRFRPILVMAAAQACGMESEKVIPAALAIELIHNFSLTHDDLPCMDNDMERRGRATCHAVYGETNALLAGDGLLIYAFNLIKSSQL